MSMYSKLITADNKKDDVKDEDTYYYFTDHLGSTTHITDKGGKDENRTELLTASGVKNIIKYALEGKSIDPAAGRGTLINNTKFETNQLKHGKIR